MVEFIFDLPVGILKDKKRPYLIYYNKELIGYLIIIQKYRNKGIGKKAIDFVIKNVKQKILIKYF